MRDHQKVLSNEPRLTVDQRKDKTGFFSILSKIVLYRMYGANTCCARNCKILAMGTLFITASHRDLPSEDLLSVADSEAVCLGSGQLSKSLFHHVVFVGFCGFLQFGVF